MWGRRTMHMQMLQSIKNQKVTKMLSIHRQLYNGTYEAASSKSGEQEKKV